MIRESEFRENVTVFSELKEFCDDNGCDLLDEVRDPDYFDDEVDSWLYDAIRYGDYGWESIRDNLDGLQAPDDWYVQEDGIFEYYYPDFRDYFDDVLEWAIDNEIVEADSSDDDDDIDEFDDSEDVLELIGDFIFAACD